MNDLHSIIISFAVAGGGGSSGGSGGGEGILALYYIIGYIVSSRTKKRLKTFGAIILGVLAVCFCSIILLRSPMLLIICLAAGFFGVHNGIIGIFGKLKKQGKDTQNQLTALKRENANEWSEEIIKARTKDVYYRFQKDWSEGNVVAMKSYLTPLYYDHVLLMMYALRQLHRKNDVLNIEMIMQMPIAVYDGPTDLEDWVFIAFNIKATDVLTDQSTGKTLYKITDEFPEKWKFERIDDQWMLDGIEPMDLEPSMPFARTTTATNPIENSVAMKDFAVKNGMYFSLNWGRLLLPQRGQLFVDMPYAKTTVRNHIIGIWDGKLLVQLYSMSNGSTTFLSDGTPIRYTVGQLALPRSYDGIIVSDRRTEKTLFGRPKPPKGYKTYKMEWADFNERYHVYATNQDAVASFELLNPSFMAWLYDNGTMASIEVVDDVVYIYCTTKKSDNDYGKMLETLKRAHKELKL